ncbi:4510_t:CDS:1, partial [Ambispora leptoticha]
ENAVAHTREPIASDVTNSTPNTNETESVPSAPLPLMSASTSEGQQINSSLVASNDTLNASSDKSQATQIAVGSPSVHANKNPVTNVAVNIQPVYPNRTPVPNIMPFTTQVSPPYINQQPVPTMINGPSSQNMKQPTNGQIGNASPTYAQRSNTPRPQTVGSGPAYTQASSSRTQTTGNGPAFAQQLQIPKVASQAVPHTVN